MTKPSTGSSRRETFCLGSDFEERFLSLMASLVDAIGRLGGVTHHVTTPPPPPRSDPEGPPSRKQEKMLRDLGLWQEGLTHREAWLLINEYYASREYPGDMSIR